MTREEFLLELEDLANDRQTEEDLVFLRSRVDELKEHDEIFHRKFVAMIDAIQDLQTYGKSLIASSKTSLLN